MSEFVISESKSLEASRPNVPMSFEGAFTQFWRTSGGVGFALKIIITTALLYLALSFAVQLLIYGTLMPSVEDITIVQTSRSRLTLMMVLTYSAMLLPVVSGAAAVHRKVLFDKEPSGFPLRLGADEGRLLLVYIGFALLFLVLYFLAAFIIFLPVGMSASIVGGGAFILGLIGGIAVIAFLIFIAVRLAPLGAATIAYKRPVLIGAKAVSKYRGAISFAAYLVLTIIFWILFFLIMLPVFSKMDFSNPASIEPVSGPLSLILGSIAAFVMMGGAMWMASIGSYTLKNYMASETQTDVFN